VTTALFRPTPPALSKAARFRQILTSPELGFLMEAHNGLSARVVEETGFSGIWASGLTISTALGVRDRNEASWTQVLEVVEFMSDATRIPIMLDGDTGYGDFNNFRRLVEKLGQRDIAAVCIEDKLFPKTNSFIEGHQALADVDEFSGKIKAGKDVQTDSDFSIIARVEALIAGWGMDEALRRAEAYHAAGADGILIHSKKASPDDILDFMREWGGRAPVVIVPTMYYATPTDHFRDAKVSLIIWANHNLRASISAMRGVSERILKEETLTGIEDNVASVKEVFEITGEFEVAEAEKRYLPVAGGKVSAVVLAATRGSQLAELTEDKPKCMLDLRGRPLLRRLTQAFNDTGIRDITVVTGYKSDAVDLSNIQKVVNKAYATTGEIASLAEALDVLNGNCIVSYGDIVFRRHILELLLQSEGDIAVVVDSQPRQNEQDPIKPNADLVQCSSPLIGDVLDDKPVALEKVSSDLAHGQIHGEWIGLMKLSARGAELLRKEIEAMQADGSANKGDIPELLNRLIDKGEEPSVVYITGQWLDVNDAFDLAKARNFT
jgi:phosphoenolpyruvate phosphomutase